MKDTIELCGKVYMSRKGLAEHFGVSIAVIKTWFLRGILPTPCTLGKTLYYLRDDVEERLHAALTGAALPLERSSIAGA